MAARKLQNEIDKVLKKVDDGVGVFEDTWDKVYAATSANQKEKFEGDLKKEIKKLQRLRDQIKTWIGSSDIKDKKPLVEARKLIESKMEKFKVCEKEAKTKAYSKEALSAANISEDELDEEIEEAIEMVQGWMESLEEELESFESEAASLAGRRGRSNDPERSEQLELFTERHKFHLREMGRIVEHLEAGHLSRDQIDDIAESVEYYIDNSQEPDFYNDEFLYEDLDLDGDFDDDADILDDDDGDSNDGRELTELDDELIEATVSPSKSTGVKKKSRAQRAKVAGAEVVQAPSQPIPTPGRALPRKSSNKDNKDDGVSGSPKSLSAGKKASPAQTQSGGPIPRSPPKATPGRNGQPSAAAVVAGIASVHGNPPAKTNSSVAASDFAGSSRAWQTAPPAQGQAQGQAPTQAQASAPPAAAQGGNNSKSPQAPSAQQPGPERETPLSLLEASYGFLPDGADGERPKQYTPRNPIATPSYFPQTPHSVFENPSVFEKFETETLFFIFYYQQGTYQQYLAARELKKQSWRYHKNYLTWFQRHEEPKSITDEYEHGTYVYFDYETGWCQRKKTEFTFEYRYLEDEPC